MLREKSPLYNLPGSRCPFAKNSGNIFPRAERKSFCHGLHEFHRANLDFVKFVESVASIWLWPKAASRLGGAFCSYTPSAKTRKQAWLVHARLVRATDGVAVP